MTTNAASECYDKIDPPRFSVNEGDSLILRGQLLDEMKKPLPKASVQSLRLELYDRATGGTINDRTYANPGDGGDVLDDNGGTLTDAYLVSDCSKTSPALLTFTTPHKLIDGDRIYVTGVVGMVELNDRVYEVLAASDVAVWLVGVDSRDYSDITPDNGQAAVGLVEVELTPDDNPLVDSTTDYDAYEEHRAQLAAHYDNDAKRVTTEYAIFVKNLQKRT